MKIRIKRIPAETADDAVIMHCFETLIKNKKEDYHNIFFNNHKSTCLQRTTASSFSEM